MSDYSNSQDSLRPSKKGPGKARPAHESSRQDDRKYNLGTEAPIPPPDRRPKIIPGQHYYDCPRCLGEWHPGECVYDAAWWASPSCDAKRVWAERARRAEAKKEKAQ